MDQHELEIIIDRYGDDILSFCCYLTRCQEEAEDLCQDTFLQAFQKRSSIINDEHAKSFLLSVAVKLWKNRRRKFAWRRRIMGDRFIPMLEQESGKSINTAAPEVINEHAEQNRIVRECVDALPEKLKLPILLYYTEGLKEREIAETLALPLGTVKSRLAQAKSTLAISISKELPQEK